MRCNHPAYVWHCALITLMLVAGLPVQQAAAQETIPPDTIQTSSPADTVQQSSGNGPPSDLTQQPGSPQASRQATEGVVNFRARDSLVFRFQGDREGILVGGANVSQSESQISAGRISLFLDNREVHAQTDTPEDSLSHPTLQRGEEQIRSSRILFNYETEKGKFDAAQIQIQDGHLTGNQVKNVSRSEVFVEQGRYSTCPPTHMYYYLQFDRGKVVDEEEFFFTNARLYILGIPYPIVFPFGYVPAGIEQRESGLLEPTYVYQNVERRGIGLQNIGWFQYINDYLTAQTSFDIYTSGSFFNESRLQYRVMDGYNGSITFGYSKERGMEPTDLDYTESVNKRISVRHTQDFSPFANISADINLNTSDYYQRNSYDIDERAQTSSSSSVSYRYRHPDNLFNFNISARLNQQFATNTTRLSGPESSFSLRQFTPFENSSPGAQQPRWYETLSISYNNNFKSEFEFRPVAQQDAEINWLEALLDPSKYREATDDDRHLRTGFRQQAQLSISRLVPSQYVNVTASTSMTEYWYPSTIRKEFNPDENRVETFQENGFAAARDFQTGINFSTTLYGVSQAQIGTLEGFRHTIRPSIGFSYRPDFSEEMWGFYRDVQTNADGRTQRYSIFENGVYGGPGMGELQNLNFTLGNVLETKQVRRDSTGEINSRNLRIIDNFNISSSYNLAADSLNFSQINMTLSSRVIENVSIQLSANYDLYARDENGFRIQRYIWQESGKFMQPLRYSANISTQFRYGPSGFQQAPTPMYQPYDPLDQAFFSPVDERFNMQPVQSPNSGISFGLNFTYSWQHRTGESARERAILNVSNIQFNLTPKWSFSTRLGYDFIEKELTPSQFNLNRDLECWTLSFQFNPFGDFQYYFFRLRINSGQIQSLFQKLPLLNNLERSSSPTGRSPRF